jgi:ubiquinone/menaquinone biosynthesis C-methylase UbiE
MGLIEFPMSDLPRRNPTGRFTGLADKYAKYRPSYPAEAIDYISTRCGLRSDSLLVDVGCGTGISARLFSTRGVDVIGIEPNAEMRATASATSPGPAERPVTYRDGRAESTGLPEAVADVVLAAQAFHWFEPDAALREFQRILKPDGWAALMWNERDEQDSFTAAYGAVIRTGRDTAAIEKPRQEKAGKVLLSSQLFRDAEQVTFRNNQVLDEDGLLGRSFSASYAPREASEVAAWTDQLRTLFSQHQRGGTVVLQYQTSIYLGRRS